MSKWAAMGFTKQWVLKSSIKTNHSYKCWRHVFLEKSKAASALQTQPSSLCSCVTQLCFTHDQGAQHWLTWGDYRWFGKRLLPPTQLWSGTEANITTLSKPQIKGDIHLYVKPCAPFSDHYYWNLKIYPARLSKISLACTQKESG